VAGVWGLMVRRLAIVCVLQLSDRMMEKLHMMRHKFAKLSAQKATGGGGGGSGVSDAMLKQRLEEESKKIRAEFGDKSRKMLEQEKQMKKMATDYKKVQEDLASKQSEHARACQELRDLEASRDTAISQVCCSHDDREATPLLIHAAAHTRGSSLSSTLGRGG